MTGFTKLFNSILHSTIWQESHETRLVWITMLAMSNRHGEVQASVPGLAHAARVTKTGTKRALKRLESLPAEQEGIEVTADGWLMLNHAPWWKLIKEDGRRIYNRDKTRKHRAKKKPKTPCARPVEP